MKIDCSTDINRYDDEGHVVYLTASENNVNRGILAEELQHSIDYLTGIHDRRVINKLKKKYGEPKYNDIWHAGVFNRIAESLDNDPNSIFHVFLDKNDVAGFREAAKVVEKR